VLVFDDSVHQEMIGKRVENFSHFRRLFWMSAFNSHEAMIRNICKKNELFWTSRMSPFCMDEQITGRRVRYELHHINPIHNGGCPYDLSNILACTPMFHAELLDPLFHYKSGH
jgi:hypothetical protein